ncbi:MAG: formyltransferase family protein, partial [Pygmaiobacter sp.]
MRILFMGTPDIAAASLAAILAAGHEVCCVYTREDKPIGRSHLPMPPPVKALALQHGLTIRQPKTLRDKAEYAAIAALAPDLIVVVAYGRILPGEIL